jgi:hypothetical protein
MARNGGVSQVARGGDNDIIDVDVVVDGVMVAGVAAAAAVCVVGIDDDVNLVSISSSDNNPNALDVTSVACVVLLLYDDNNCGDDNGADGLVEDRDVAIIRRINCSPYNKNEECLRINDDNMVQNTYKYE